MTLNLNLDKIYNSGQVFTWFKDDVSGVYTIYSGDKVAHAVKIDDSKWELCGFAPSANIPRIKEYWSKYFCLDAPNVVDSLSFQNDDYLAHCLQEGQGICILSQALWDTIVCFMISQNNNIKRIRTSVHDMIRDFGRIPTAHQMLQFGLQKYHLGYREAYLLNFAKLCLERDDGYCRPIDDVTRDPYDKENIRKWLLSFTGIGPKVADCILLFGYHDLSAFPVDTHVKQIMAEHYPCGLPAEYLPIAGLLQQYMFYWETNKKVL